MTIFLSWLTKHPLPSTSHEEEGSSSSVIIRPFLERKWKGDWDFHCTVCYQLDEWNSSTTDSIRDCKRERERERESASSSSRDCNPLKTDNNSVILFRTGESLSFPHRENGDVFRLPSSPSPFDGIAGDVIAELRITLNSFLSLSFSPIYTVYIADNNKRNTQIEKLFPNREKYRIPKFSFLFKHMNLQVVFLGVPIFEF